EYFNNGGSSQIDVIIANSNGAYWNKLTSTISSISPSSGPWWSSVTISGANFGASQGSSTVSFNGVAASVSSWTSNQVLTTDPCNVTNGPVVVTVGGAPSNAVNFSMTSPS